MEDVFLDLKMPPLLLEELNVHHRGNGNSCPMIRTCIRQEIQWMLEGYGEAKQKKIQELHRKRLLSVCCKGAGKFHWNFRSFVIGYSRWNFGLELWRKLSRTLYCHWFQTRSGDGSKAVDNGIGRLIFWIVGPILRSTHCQRWLPGNACGNQTSMVIISRKKKKFLFFKIFIKKLLLRKAKISVIQVWIYWYFRLFYKQSRLLVWNFNL